jgi:hypothetical protein
MTWTLNDALQECARNTYNTKTMIRSSTGYSGKGLDYVRRLLSGINYAINKVCREKIGILHIEEVTLDDTGAFNLSALTYRCLRVRSIGSGLNFLSDAAENITVPGQVAGAQTIVYEYLPAELTVADLDNPLPTDERYVDPRTLCQYANYQFLSEEGTEYDSARAQVWLGLFNDSFENIVAANRLSKRVRYNG